MKGLFEELLNPRVSSRQASRSVLRRLRRRAAPQKVRLNNAVHTVTLAPTGTGKSSALIVDFLRTNDESAVVVDLKGELAKLSAREREAMGHQTVLLDPFGLVTKQSGSLNVAHSMQPNSDSLIDDGRQVAAAMIERKDSKGDTVHFLDTAENVLAAITCLVAQYADPEKKSLQTVCDIVNNPKLWEQAVATLCQSTDLGGMLARLGGSLAHLKERELASTLSTVARFTRFLTSPPVAAVTSSSSFDPAALRREKVTVYIIIPPSMATTLAPLIRLWVGSLMRACMREGLHGSGIVNFICDEANSLQNMDQIATGLTVGRAYNVRIHLFYQDLGQVKKCWPDGADQTILANCTQIFFAVQDLETARMVSERLGEATITVSSGGVSHGTTRQGNDDKTSYSTTVNDNWSLQARKLLKPEEVLVLHPRVALTFTPGMRPICTILERYYEVSRAETDSWATAFRDLRDAVAFFLFAALTAWLVTQVAFRAPREPWPGSAPFGPIPIETRPRPVSPQPEQPHTKSPVRHR